MKIHFLLYLASVLLLFSCTTQSKKSLPAGSINTEQVLNQLETQSPNDKIFNAIPWGKLELEKNTFQDIIQTKKNVDMALVNFFHALTKTESELNESTFNLSCYNSLTTSFNSPNEETPEIAVQFKRMAEKHGFLVTQEEGMLYLVVDFVKIKAEFIDRLNSPNKQFLKLYSEEMECGCCKEGAVVLSEPDLAKRAYQWGSLIDEAEGLAFADIVESEYKKYLTLLFAGIDNSPAFDWENGKYNPKLLDATLKLVEKYPNSRAAGEFVSYIALLKAENYKQSKKVNQYLAERLK